MTKRFFRLIAVLFLSPFFSVSAADWLTFGHDPQRSGWAIEENILTTKNVSELELLWKAQMKNEPKALASLTAPLVASDVVTPQGVKTLVYVAGSSNHLFALDAENGSVVWSRTFESRALPTRKDTWLCPQGINATPTIEKKSSTIYALAMDGKLFGLDLGTGQTKFGPIQFVAPFSKSWSLNLVDGILYTSLSQNCGDARSGIYSIDIREPFRPLIRHLLVTTGRGGPSGIWGRGGPVVGKNDRIYGAVGDGEYDPSIGKYGSSIIGASLDDLRIVDYYTPENWRKINKYDWDLGATSPVWFAHQGYNLLSVGAKEGVVYLIDGDTMGDKDHHTPLYITPRLGNDEDTFEGKGVWGSLSAWRDDEGQTWVYVPMLGPVSKHAPKFPVANGPNPDGSVMAFKVAMDNVTKRPVLKPAWISGNFSAPEPVVIANGVVFALSSGENLQQTKEGGIIFEHKLTLLSELERKEKTARAVLHALDARTGKVLYESGTAIDTWVHFSGLAVANGRVYAVDHASQVYCFGLKPRPMPNN